MTYHNSITLAKICLASVDEETSSAAQEMVSDAGRHSSMEKGIILRAPNYQGCAHWKIRLVDHRQET